MGVDIEATGGRPRPRQWLVGRAFAHGPRRQGVSTASHSGDGRPWAARLQQRRGGAGGRGKEADANSNSFELHGAVRVSASSVDQQRSARDG